MSRRVRQCDKFGAAVQLSFQGEAKSGTLGGGTVSVCLGGLILAYFCMRMLAVVNYQDPAVTNYFILEDRSLQEPINFADYN